MKSRGVITLVMLGCLFALSSAASDAPLKIVSASYFNGDKSCDAMRFVAARCDGQGRCEFTPSNAMCGDPRENFPKQLRVSFSCNGSIRDVVVGEADRVILSCSGAEMPVMRLHERLDLNGAEVQRQGEFKIDIPAGYRHCRHQFMEHSAAPLGKVKYQMIATAPDFVFSYDVPCAGVNVGKLLRQSGNEKAEAAGKLFERELECVGGGSSWLHLGISVQVAKDGESCPANW